MNMKTSATFIDPDDVDQLTIHILRNWDREKTERFAKHLLGSEYRNQIIDQCIDAVCNDAVTTVRNLKGMKC